MSRVQRKLLTFLLLSGAILCGPLTVLNAWQPGRPEYRMREALRIKKKADQAEAIFLDPRGNPFQVSTWGLVDAIRYPSGRIVYLRDYYGPSHYNFGESELGNLSYIATREYKHYKRLIAYPDDPKNIYAISAKGKKRNYGHTVYRHSLNNSEAEAVAGFREGITRPEYFVSKSGVAYIYGRNGLIYRWSMADGLSRWQVDPPSHIQEKRRNMFSRLQAIEIGNAVCFYSLIDPEFPKKELRDLLVFRGQTPQAISLSGRSTGPAFAVDDKTIRFCKNAGFLDVNIDSGELTETPFERPKVDDQELVVTHYFRLPNKQISLWRKKFRSFKEYDIDGFDNGYYNQFAELQENGQWKMLSEGRDRLLYTPDNWVADNEGGIWMTTGELGLKYITPEGGFHEIGFGNGFGFGAIGFMKLDPNGHLMVVSKAIDHLAYLDPKELLKAKNELTGQWRVVFSRIPLEWDKHDRMLLLSNKRSEGLMDFQRGTIANIPLPLSKDLIVAKPLTITRDTNNEIWIFTESKPDRTFWRHQDEWKMFEPKKLDDGTTLPSKEVAFQSRMEMGVDETYVIGRRFNKYRVSFGPDNKIVFKNEGLRVSYFNGKVWAKSRKGMELLDGSSLEQQPFFLNGVTTIYASESAWNLTDAQWEEHRETDEPRPWNTIEAVTYPFEGEQYFNVANSYPDGPFSEEESDWGYRASNILMSFVRAHDKLGIHYPAGIWNVLPVAGTPMESDSSFDSIWIDYDNRWFFQYPAVSGMHRYIIYEPLKTIIEPVNKDLGVIEQPFTAVKPEWKTDPPLQKANFRYRVSDGEWSAWQSEEKEILLEGFSLPGKYKIEIQLASEPRPLPRHTLTYDFDVKYSLEGYVKPLVEQLQSDDYQTRRDATEKLLQLGKAAIPHMQPLLKSRDAEVRMTAEMVIKLLESKNQSNQSDNDE